MYANAHEDDSELDALELFKRDARIYICKCKHEKNRKYWSIEFNKKKYNKFKL